MRRTDPTSTTRRRTSVRTLIATALVLSMLPMFATFAPGGQVAGFTTASSASADQIWYQSVGRAHADAPCQESSAEDLAIGWNQWSPSWEQWANNGNGGFVCSRQITWDFTTSPSSAGRTSPFGEIGPGGGLIFLRSGGKTYEMAPSNWSSYETTGVSWCTPADLTSVTGVGIGVGASNTLALLAACTSSTDAAEVASAYNGGGFTDWYLPSEDELNAMCLYSRNPAAPAAPTTPCNNGSRFSGTQQNTDFKNGEFGFNSSTYWTSTYYNHSSPRLWWSGAGPLGINFNIGNPDPYPTYTLAVRPIRSY